MADLFVYGYIKPTVITYIVNTQDNYTIHITMKNAHYLIIFSIVCSCLLSCNKNTSNRSKKTKEKLENFADFASGISVFDYNLEAAADNDSVIFINEIADSIQYLPLEFDREAALLTEFLMLFEWQEKIFISSYSSRYFPGICQFDKEGNFEQVAVKVGRGHSELTKGFYKWSYDESSCELVVCGNGRIFNYSLLQEEGDFIPFSTYSHNAVALGKGHYAILNMSFEHPGSTDISYLQILNEKGRVVKSYYYSQKRTIFYRLPQSSCGPLESYKLYQSYNGDAMFKDVFNDTIFVVNKDSVSPSYCLYSGEKSPRVEDATKKEKKKSCVYIKKISDTKRYIISTYTHSDCNKTVIFDRTSGEVAANASVLISNHSAGVYPTRNRHFAVLKTPDDRDIYIGIVSTAENIIYAVASPGDVAAFVPGVTSESNPVIIKIYLK
ncbi:MAG: hypothetical protein WCZ67_02210 [Bacteroidales bacterium]|jgi:hypothetical protein